MATSSNLRFLITAGPTREFLDPVRFLSNRSSGKMGYALAAAARAVSPHVTLVSGPTSLEPPRGVTFAPVTTAQEMAAVVAKQFARADVVIMAAAVCDFRPRHPARHKIKKRRFPQRLELVPTVDILAGLGRRKTTQTLVGFAVETRGLERQARSKLREKRLDWIVANDATAFDADTNTVVLFSRSGQRERLGPLPKRRLARQIVRRVLAAR